MAMMKWRRRRRRRRRRRGRWDLFAHAWRKGFLHAFPRCYSVLLVRSPLLSYLSQMNETDFLPFVYFYLIFSFPFISFYFHFIYFYFAENVRARARLNHRNSA